MAASRPVPKLDGLIVAGDLRRGTSSKEWSLDTLAGRLVEISGSAATAALTAAAELILEAQHRGESAAWVTDRESTFFPPDFAAAGIDLAALPVIQVADSGKVSKIADTLLRSGGFAIVVLDLGARMVLSIKNQTRLAGLAKKYHSALVCLTRKARQAPSLGSLISLRAEINKKRTSFDRFTCELRIVKDKRRGPGWRHVEVCRGTDGLC